MALSLPANNALFSPIYHAQPRKGFCCCCCGPFKDAVYAASITTIIMQLMIPILGLSGTIDVLYTMGLLENLSHVTYNGMEQLEILEHEAWIFFVILGALVAILTLIPMYGTYKKHIGMIGFGIGLLLTTAISQYAAAALYIKKANEIVCQDGNSACLSNQLFSQAECQGSKNLACRYNQFRQPIVVYITSGLCVLVFAYGHAQLIQEIRQEQQQNAPSSDLDGDDEDVGLDVELEATTNTSVSTIADDSTSEEGELS